VYATQLLALGQNAHHMLVSQTFSFPPNEKELAQQFYPMLASVIVDDIKSDAPQTDLPERKLNPSLVASFRPDANPIARKVRLMCRNLKLIVNVGVLLLRVKQAAV
jgi:hypothetical protein